MKALRSLEEAGGEATHSEAEVVCNTPLPVRNRSVNGQVRGRDRTLVGREAQVQGPVHPGKATIPPLVEGTFSSIREARHVVDDFDMDLRVRDAAALVLSELTTNAMLHAGGSFTLRLWHTHDWARIEVQDASARLPLFPRGVPVARSLSGRGLFIVEVLSDLWGAELRDSGKVVWAEVGRRPAGYIDLRHS